ncbi:MAG: hypothetical protein GC185_07510 [Alphaproteobacteria bacterium]|nr:hypothetical protein [Alphaproteobacteria bacterium]
MKRSKLSHKLAAIATMGVIAGSNAGAYAGTALTFRDMSNHIITATSNFTGLISTVCYLGGGGLGVAGIFKLKQHVDNPNNTPLKDGLVRIGCGGGLLSFPFIEAAMQGSISNSSLNGISAGQLTLGSTSAFSAP